MITIYQAEWCPYCRHVREWISENLPHVPITFIAEPHSKPERKDLIEATGQNGIPSLVNDEDKTVIPDDDDKIIDYLAKKFRVQSPAKGEARSPRGEAEGQRRQESRVKESQEGESCPI